MRIFGAGRVPNAAETATKVALRATKVARRATKVARRATKVAGRPEAQRRRQSCIANDLTPLATWRGGDNRRITHQSWRQPTSDSPLSSLAQALSANVLVRHRDRFGMRATWRQASHDINGGNGNNGRTKIDSPSLLACWLAGVLACWRAGVNVCAVLCFVPCHYLDRDQPTHVSGLNTSYGSHAADRKCLIATSDRLLGSGSVLMASSRRQPASSIDDRIRRSFR